MLNLRMPITALGISLQAKKHASYIFNLHKTYKIANKIWLQSRLQVNAHYVGIEPLKCPLEHKWLV